MHIAILNANTDKSAFAKLWPDDAEKFSVLISEIKPDWICTTFDLTQSEYPKTLEDFDGFLISGSPSSVNSNADWIEGSLTLTTRIIEGKIPLFGACFGHQLIAKAMGVEVIKNPNGWVLGTVSTDLAQLPDWLNKKALSWQMYAAHTEQVESLPVGTTLMCQNDNCSIGGFYKESLIFTTQYHPEMNPDFITALVDELKPIVDQSVFDNAKDSLSQKSDRILFASWIIKFFESST